MMNRLPSIDPKKDYIIFDLTDENDIWEADVFGSTDGRNPSTPRFHLMLGECVGKGMLVEAALEMIGWAVADQRKFDEPMIWQQAEDARTHISTASPNTEIIVNISTGGIRIGNAVAILQRGATRRDTGNP